MNHIKNPIMNTSTKGVSPNIHQLSLDICLRLLAKITQPYYLIKVSLYITALRNADNIENITYADKEQLSGKTKISKKVSLGITDHIINTLLQTQEHCFFKHMDRHCCSKSGNIPKIEGGQIHLIFLTVLRSP